MKFSIVIPTLNEEKYISGILGSLADQTHKDFEVIVVDSPKTSDDTKKVAANFREKMELHILTAPKGGVSFQRNYGAEKANHDYVMFFDADTLVEPVFLEKINLFLTNHPGVDILSCWVIPISKKIRDKMIFWAFNNIYMEAMKKVNPVALGAFIYVNLKSFKDAGMFSEEVVLAEDYELAQRMFRKGYKYALLRDPNIYFSMRRFDKVGRMNLIKMNLKAGIHYYFKGPIKDYNLFKYDMDGNIR